MLNIKEIALNVADSLRNKIDGISHMQSNQGLVRFAEALIAEIAKENKPICWLRPIELEYPEDKLLPHVEWDKKRLNTQPLFAFPPTAEQIANETAEAIAEYCRNQDHYCLATEIESGAWREFKA